jgi:hypothetical protein
MTDCSFRHCTGNLGGSFYNEYSNDAKLTRCLFELNHARDWGGGFVVRYGQSLTISECDVFNNSAVGRFGGCYAAGSTSFTMHHFRLYDNIADSRTVGSFSIPDPFDFDEFDIRFNESYSILQFEAIGKLIIHDHHFGPRLLLSSQYFSMFSIYRSSIEISNCSFDSIRALGGAAIIMADNSNAGTVVISGCTFENVSSTGQGGCIYATYLSLTSLTNSSFSHCSGQSGGVLYSARSADLDLIRCAFESNRATVNGAVFVVDNGIRWTIEECRFLYNGQNGSGISLWVV